MVERDSYDSGKRRGFLRYVFALSFGAAVVFGHFTNNSYERKPAIVEFYKLKEEYVELKKEKDSLDRSFYRERQKLETRIVDVSDDIDAIVTGDDFTKLDAWRERFFLEEVMGE